MHRAKAPTGPRKARPDDRLRRVFFLDPDPDVSRAGSGSYQWVPRSYLWEAFIPGGSPYLGQALPGGTRPP
jgi:hypothetical protein